MFDKFVSPTFQVGDIVRVKAARRPDVHYRIAQLTATHFRAVNASGNGEAYHLVDAFERVEPLGALWLTDEMPTNRGS